MPTAVAKAATVLKVASIIVDVRIDLAAANRNSFMIMFVVVLVADWNSPFPFPPVTLVFGVQLVSPRDSNHPTPPSTCCNGDIGLVVETAAKLAMAMSRSSAVGPVVVKSSNQVVDSLTRSSADVGWEKGGERRGIRVGGKGKSVMGCRMGISWARVSPCHTSKLNHGLDETVPEQPSTLNCKPKTGNRNRARG